MGGEGVIKRDAVSSHAMRSVGYQRRTLEIEFESGNVYRYFDVPPALYRAFITAESLGEFFNEEIRDRFRSEGPL